MSDELEKKLRDYYSKQKLSPAKVRSLKRARQRQTYPRWIAAAAAVVFVVAGSWLWQEQTHKENWHKAAAEVALNHNKNLAPDYTVTEATDTKAFAGLAEKMTMLDFELTGMPGPQAAGLKLTGARYCSIQGKIAAQLRFLKSKQTVTGYIAEPADGLKGLLSFTTVIDGVRVELWQTGGLVYALARDE